MKIFEVIDPGLHTTVQDLGRIGYQKYGIVPAGAMDDYSFQLGNLLLGNERHAAGLEITMLGPTLRILNDTEIVIAGANLSPTLNKQPIPMWTSIHVSKGDELGFGKPQSGTRAYILVEGGIDVPDVMGSKATYVKAQIGGYEGRALQVKDVIQCHGSVARITENSMTSNRRKTISFSATPNLEMNSVIRVIPGPQESMFSEETIEKFYNSTYKISTQSDRMGYRLEGEPLIRHNSNEMITDAVTEGSIQVPSDGQPIVLMADRQTSGGYPKIANVISVDLWKVAQRLPGQSLSFKKVSVTKAHDELRKREQLFSQLHVGVTAHTFSKI
ncbi:biotin-dependent carboxyltransferase family protein [Evansella sp. AB-P1]|uniref:5-oxoprolinase subunit C family protein n=1 Tax=Evansella sp. AB-P1 TaxID=3037653 RepID=UPI0024202A98|nr:biotin-dependent carboxyltransferase family protein [Evansella sp. AB-P1]MDG5787445.1 biotin-dependent carboxyltransferase family protein [Evansella sp. AB-P1]